MGCIFLIGFFTRFVFIAGPSLKAGVEGDTGKHVAEPRTADNSRYIATPKLRQVNSVSDIVVELSFLSFSRLV